MAMPKNWTEQTKGRMQAQKRYVRVRKHPGTTKNGQPLEHALKDVHMCVTWGSGAGVKSIVAGVPVYYELPGWIGAAAATRDINKPYLGDRSVMLTRLAWAQWRISEIETGEPLDNLFIHGGFKTCV